jgi:hypothetical protein
MAKRYEEFGQGNFPGDDNLNKQPEQEQLLYLKENSKMQTRTRY